VRLEQQRKRPAGKGGARAGAVAGRGGRTGPGQARPGTAAGAQHEGQGEGQDELRNAGQGEGRDGAHDLRFERSDDAAAERSEHGTDEAAPAAKKRRRRRKPASPREGGLGDANDAGPPSSPGRNTPLAD